MWPVCWRSAYIAKKEEQDVKCYRWLCAKMHQVPMNFIGTWRILAQSLRYLVRFWGSQGVLSLLHCQKPCIKIASLLYNCLKTLHNLKWMYIEMPPENLKWDNLFKWHLGWPGDLLYFTWNFYANSDFLTIFYV